MAIYDAVLSQKQELEGKVREGYISRSVGDVDFNSPLIKVVTGPRRAGKSFYAIHALREKGIHFGYLNFDDERIGPGDSGDDIINAIHTVYNNPKHLLFDEIQNFEKWELFINRLHRNGFNLIVTGSNSNLLSKELATHLTGRHAQIRILPFSFSEYLLSLGRELTESEIKAQLSQYIVTGGYPEPLIKKLDVKDYLSMLVNSIVYKDIVKRYKVRFVQGVENLSNYLFSNIANEFSFNRLSKLVGVKSSHTVEKYESYLEEAFLFFHLRRFSYKIREQIASNRKIYAIDNGLVTAKAFQISRDLGKLYENAVGCELLRRTDQGGTSLYYYKNAQQEEVDFVVKGATQVSGLIQVCYDVSNGDTRRREIRALLKAGKELNCDNLTIINNDLETVEDEEWFGLKGKIKYQPLHKWLLNPV